MKYTSLLSGLLISGALLAQEVIPEQQQLLSDRKVAYFRENKGQVKDQHWQPRPDVLYSGEVNGLVYHLKKDGIHYQLNRVEKWCETKAEEGHASSEGQVPARVGFYRVDINWLNTNSEVQIKRGYELGGYENFYNVPDGTAPALFVKRYAGVTYKNLYPGIDLHFFENSKGNMEYDYMVQPGADYRQIQIEVEGAKLRVNDKKALFIETPFGTIKEGALKVYQDGQEIVAHWQVNGNRVSFDIPEHNPTYALHIDPPVRLWGTYYGGTLQDEGWSCAIDTHANVYLAGQTSSADAIATSDTHQDTMGGVLDAFVAKFDENGTRLWGTYYGGSSWDRGRSCATDEEGSVFLAGWTESTDAIASAGAHQTMHGGGNQDAFLVKLYSNGVRNWGTYYGGANADEGWSCATNSNGDIFLSGWTESASSIATTGAHQENHGGGNTDAFLVKFDASGNRIWGTYYGGNNTDESRSCATDGDDNVLLAGFTRSIDNISPGGTIGGDRDAFLAKFDDAGTRQWGNYYGGTDSDRGFSCTADNNGNVFLAGRTQSTNAIATTGAHQVTYGGGLEDAFIAKFNANGSTLWGTYYGGSNGDRGWSCAADDDGNVFLAGWTESTDAIASSGAFQTGFGDGDFAAFLVMFAPGGAREWGTYYGGDGSDFGYSCTSNGMSHVFLTGSTTSSVAMATSNAHQDTLGSGSSDAFLAKFDTATTIGVDKMPQPASFSIYPNPNPGTFIVVWDEQAEVSQVTIVNVLGETVYHKEIEQGRSSHNVTLDVPRHGVFFVQVHMDNTTYVERMVVNR